MRLLAVSWVCACVLGAAPMEAYAQSPVLAEVIPNDNRMPAAIVSHGVLEFTLHARLAAWRPDLDVDSAVTVQAFSGADGVPRVPGPLLRAESGTEVRLTIRNDVPDSTLVVHGLRAGMQANDTIVVRPGTSRVVRYVLGAPGTYLYWGTTSGRTRIADRQGRDGQLTGAIVVDAPGVAPAADERIFVITVIDILPDTTKPPPHEDIWDLAINGRGWPHSERLRYPVGDTIRWRWLNGSYLPHPMHLHGFHYRVLAKGDGQRDRTYPADEVRAVVTEFMLPGSTFAMDWVPTRAGNWLFHCHMAPHISPYPERPDSARAHDEHDVAHHALYGMAGLVLGIETVQGTSPAAASHRAPAHEVVPSQHLRLFAQQRTTAAGTIFGYALQQGAEPAADSVTVPGPPLVLVRGETTAITVVNRTTSHTTVHWHGMELESIYDGVAGWSGAAAALAPLILPGDSFTVAFTPPRAGTFIYHTHMDETAQLSTGMYGAMLVLEPGERYDAEHDVLFVLGGAAEGDTAGPALNGHFQPPVLTFHAGTTHRLRLINILPTAPVEVQLSQDSTILEWRPVSKDGAALPESLQRAGPATLFRVGVGETYDAEWTPQQPGEVVLRLTQPREGWSILQRIRVR